MEYQTTLFVVLLTSWGISFSASVEELTAVHLERKLPMPLYNTLAKYDGKDSIYLVGGVSGNRYQNLILRFDLSTLEFEALGNIPGFEYIYDGTLQADSDGSLYYFGGDSSYTNQVYKFNPELNQTVEMADLPYTVLGSTSQRSLMKNGSASSQVLIFGGNGRSDGILSFDMETLESKTFGRLSHDCYPGNSVLVNTKAYVFCPAENSTDLGAQFIIDLMSLDMEALQLDWPRVVLPQQSVFDGNDIYVIGGYMSFQGMDTNGLIKLNPENKAWTQIHVENMPLRTDEYFYRNPPTAVCVEKDNRIFFFGGLSTHRAIGDLTYHDEVWYVDLNPNTPTPTAPATTTDSTSIETTTSITTTTTFSPDVFNCNNRTNGNHTYPLDCSKYITCLDGIGEINMCPILLLFDPIRLECNETEFVDCTAQRLTAVHLETKLPMILHSITTYYDGNDYIYLFGGTRNSSYQDHILRYDINSATLNELGSLPHLVHGANAHADQDGNIFIIGGAGFGDYVQKFNPNTNESERVGNLPNDFSYASSVQREVGSPYIHIFSGNGDRGGIRTYHMDTLSSYAVGQIPNNFLASSAVRKGKKAFVFGYPPRNSSFNVVDLDTLNVESVQGFPKLWTEAKAIWNGESIYLIGGYGSSETGVSTTGIIRVDPCTYSWNLIPVDSFPLPDNDSYYRYPPSAVYVEKLNRVFMFGGVAWDTKMEVYTYFDTIWYIDLSPRNPAWSVLECS